MAVIGVDREGIVAGRLVSRLKRIPLYYWSLELYFFHEAKSLGERILKLLERRASRAADCVIIQDEDRAAALVDENRIHPDRIVLVPNSPMGPVESSRGRFFHDKFDLPEDELVVAQIGGIAPGMYSLELAAATSTWPENTCLVLHERMRRREDEPYLQEIRRVGGERVRLSLDPVSLGDVPKVVASCDIGLVFYRKDLGPNVTNIAGASGKLAYYLKCGVPVICIDFPGLVDVVDAYGCGVCVTGVDEVGSALERIFSGYDRYAANAARCFEDRYEFRKHFAAVSARLSDLAAGANSMYSHSLRTALKHPYQEQRPSDDALA